MHPLLKTALVYLGISVLCLLFSRVYALYGHGVTSPAMTWLLLYPLIGGTLIFLLMWRFGPTAIDLPHYRACFNLYNSGVATLATGSLLKGIFDIAGTSSPYTIVFYLVGGVWIVAGVTGLAASERRKRKTAHIQLGPIGRRPGESHEHGRTEP